MTLILFPSFSVQELLPFVADGIDDDDEVLVAVAAALGNLVAHVGGSEHAETLLAPLELLLTVGKFSSLFVNVSEAQSY